MSKTFKRAPRLWELKLYLVLTWVWFSGKEFACNARDEGDVGSIPGSGRSPGGETATPLQYSCLGNPMDRGAWRATVHGVAKSWTQLKRQSTHIPPGYRLSLDIGYLSCCSRIMRQGLPSSREPGCLQQNYFINSLSITSLVASRYRICLLMQETEFWSLGWEDPLEQEMATHFSILA